MWLTTKQAASFDKVERSGEKKLANRIWTKERGLTTTFYRRRKEIPLKALTEITSRNSRNFKSYKRGRIKEEEHNICITLWQFPGIPGNFQEFEGNWLTGTWLPPFPGIPHFHGGASVASKDYTRGRILLTTSFTCCHISVTCRSYGGGLGGAGAFFFLRLVFDCVIVIGGAEGV